MFLVFRRVLLPDLKAIAVWLLPVAGVHGAVALLGLWLRQLGLTSLVNGLVFVIWISLWLKNASVRLPRISRPLKSRSPEQIEYKFTCAGIS